MSTSVTFGDTGSCSVSFFEQSMQNQQRQQQAGLDALLADAKTEVGFETFSKLQEEANGLVQVHPEDDATVNQCLQILKFHLNRIKYGTSLQTAEAMDSEYVHSREFQTMFLRVTRYDPEAAAQKMVKFFKVKESLFGSEKLVKDITMDDLNDQDKASLKTGSLQVLVLKDMAGRSILFNAGSRIRYHTLKNELRARFYTMMHVAKSEDSQKRGVAFITYALGAFEDATQPRPRVSDMSDMINMICSLPIYISAYNLCMERLSEYIVVSACLPLFPKQFRARVTLHRGSHLECEYSLAAIGIPKVCLPISPDNEIILYYHLNWYQRCIENDSEVIVDNQEDAAELMDEDDLTTDIVPQPPDFLGGTGQGFKFNGGNMFYQDLIETYRDQYEQAKTSKEKVEVSELVILRMCENRSRFLRINKASHKWEEVPHLEARQKVAKSFRNRRRIRVSTGR